MAVGAVSGFVLKGVEWTDDEKSGSVGKGRSVGMISLEG